MLDAETKRRIDNARDILVGKVPDPKTQVEQITFAMIYKFMDDMDQQSVGIGGEPSFFTNGYEQYAWSKLMDKRLGGEARLDLYVRALDQMSQNPHIPQLFRDIFKGAFLPYRDSETLNLFLKEMQGFTYEHSEDLGDAYEYLLSIFASQGKAGQFRTPRHIIDFIVDCVNPTKDDTVLDPACGTSGFLISAYKHILEAHAQNPLSPDEKQRLTENFVGYDISPDMVRLSRVNMYLHQFPNPTIHEYDTLTTEDRWDENYDVILANPPFMTPKGGIRPHNRFAVRANRSEVLFVDYIAEHLNPGGRAGVVVPEGIIFQSGNAYKALRRMLVEEGYLYGVVSLPAGVFNPYSGVKTSILLLDKTLARRSDSILFVKISADGFDLGAQRREIERDDVPEALRLVKAFQEDPSQPLPGNDLAQIVLKSRLAENGEYNLSAERYRESESVSNKWPTVKVQDIVKSLVPPKKIQKHDYLPNGKFPIIDQGKELIAGWTNDDSAVLNNDNATIIFGDHTCIIKYIDFPFAQGADGIKILSIDEKLLPRYFYYFLKAKPVQTEGYKRHFSKLTEMSVPIPPVEVQQKVLEEIEGYQKVIDGARQVVENYKPTITIDPSWPKFKLEDVCEKILGGGTPSTKVETYWEGSIPWISSADILGLYQASPRRYITQEAVDKSATNRIPRGNVIVVTRVGLGKLFYNDFDVCISQDCHGVIVDRKLVDSEFLLFILTSEVEKFKTESRGSTIQGVTKDQLSSIMIALPSLDIQQEIVSNIKKVNELVSGNLSLIKLMELRISDCIKSVWDQM